MTDLETIRAMFTRAGIEAEEEPRNARNARPAHTTLTVEAGYVGFYSVLEFGPDGALVSVEAFE